MDANAELQKLSTVLSSVLNVITQTPTSSPDVTGSHEQTKEDKGQTVVEKMDHLSNNFSDLMSSITKTLNDSLNSNPSDLLDRDADDDDAHSKKMRVLVAQLREQCEKIDNSNKYQERDDADTSDIFFEMGKCYRERSDEKYKVGDTPAFMLCIVRCIGLLTAALVRKSDKRGKKPVQKEIDSVIKSILKKANAAKKSYDATAIIEKAKDQIKTMRKDVDKKLKNIRPIPEQDNKRNLEEAKIKDMQNIQSLITAQYKNVMKCMWDKWVKVMGKPPCRYSVVGLGSMSRGEITPFSDFEHIIVTENFVDDVSIVEREEMIGYFRWASLLFMTSMIGLEETVVRFLFVPELNDIINKKDWFFDRHTVCGISLDGMVPYASKFPLGRLEKTPAKDFIVELIGPVKDMVQLIDSKVDMINGYHVADTVMQSCFVAGEEEVWMDFHDGINQKMIADFTIRESGLIQQCKEHATKYNVMTNLNMLQHAPKIFLKELIYRGTSLLIPFHGRRYQIYDSSSYDIIDKLCKYDFLPSDRAHDYKYALALACEFRLKVYTSNKEQSDILERHRMFMLDGTSPLEVVQHTAGDDEVYEFMCIMHDLQRFILGDSVFDYNQIESNFVIMRHLKLHARLVDEWKRLDSYDKSNVPNDLLKHVIFALGELNRYDEVIHYCKRLMQYKPAIKFKHLWNNLTLSEAYLGLPEADYGMAKLCAQNATDILEDNQSLFNNPDIPFKVYLTHAIIDSHLDNQQGFLINIDKAEKVLNENESFFRKWKSFDVHKTELMAWRTLKLQDQISDPDIDSTIGKTLGDAIEKGMAQDPALNKQCHDLTNSLLEFTSGDSINSLINLARDNFQTLHQSEESSGRRYNDKTKRLYEIILEYCNHSETILNQNKPSIIEEIEKKDQSSSSGAMVEDDLD